MSRNKSTLNNTGNKQMNKTQVIKSNNQKTKNGNNAGWNKIEHD